MTREEYERKWLEFIENRDYLGLWLFERSFIKTVSGVNEQNMPMVNQVDTRPKSIKPLDLDDGI